MDYILWHEIKPKAQIKWAVFSGGGCAKFVKQAYVIHEIFVSLSRVEPVSMVTKSGGAG